MKMMKRVAVLACLICALTTVICFANGLEFTSTEMGDDNKVVVSFYPTEAFNAGYITTKITFNKDAWTISNISGAAFTDKSATGEIGIGKTDFIETEYSPSTPILSFTAVLNEGFDVAENPFTLVKPTVANADFSNSLAMEGADIILTVTKKAAGPSTTESEVVSGTVKGHEIVGGGTTEDRTYFAKQLTLTGAEGKTVKGITTIFTPVYAEGSGKTVNPVTKSYDFDIAEGIAGGASLKFNVTLIGAPADVVSVDIQSTLTVE